jgi:ureidoglycolate dehydrogenase (NAD+)
MALDRKMAALVCTHTDPLVAPFGGRFAFLGSNPMAFAFPGRDKNILVDMATSEIPWGKVINHRNEKKPLPPGLVQDANGDPTTDADKAVSLTSFGGVKGYSISIMIEALTGLLVGGVFGPHVSKMYADIGEYRNLSNFILVIDPSVFSGGDAFLDVAQRMINELHQQKPQDGFKQVLVPGEIEEMRVAQNLKNGIAVPQAMYDFLAK